MSLRQLRWYKRQIENQFSNLHRITLHWLRIIHLILVLLAVFWVVDGLLKLVFDYYPITPFSSITIGFAILFLAAGSIIQKDLKAHKWIDAKKPPTPQKTASADTINQEMITQIEEGMANRQLFLNPDLTLNEFARKLNLPAREISYQINAGLQMSFIDFVNRYRVDQVKRLIDDDRFKHLTLLGIAFESGFNSKSTFYRVFKKMTGKSPSEYQKSIQNAH
jgi:AraC-like DNA-binding protein